MISVHADLNKEVFVQLKLALMMQASAEMYKSFKIWHIHFFFGKRQYS